MEPDSLSLVKSVMLVITVGEPGVVAVNDDLVELLLRPGAAELLPQVIQDQQARVLDLVEEAVVADAAVGGEGVPQVVQKVGDEGEEDLIPFPETCAGYRHGQVRLSDPDRLYRE